MVRIPGGSCYANHPSHPSRGLCSISGDLESGLFLQRQHEVSGEFSDHLAKEVLTSEKVWKNMLEGERSEAFTDVLREYTRDFLRREAQDVGGRGIAFGGWGGEHPLRTSHGAPLRFTFALRRSFVPPSSYFAHSSPPRYEAAVATTSVDFWDCVGRRKKTGGEGTGSRRRNMKMETPAGIRQRALHRRLRRQPA